MRLLISKPGGSVVLTGYVVAAAPAQEVKVASLVGLLHALDVEARVAARAVIRIGRRRPLGLARRQLLRAANNRTNETQY